MTTKKEHLQLIRDKGKFTIDCNHAIFSLEEIEILEKYGHWFTALTSGELKPLTELQETFVLTATNKKDPDSHFEHAWFKYLGRKKLELKHGDQLNVQYHVNEDSFYSRDQAKRMKSMMYRVINDSHKK